MTSRVSLLCAICLPCLATLFLTAWNSSSLDQKQSSTPQETVSPGPPIKFLPEVESYVLGSESAKQFAGVDKLMFRKPGSAFSGDTIARPKFATSTAPQALARLRETAERFFLATSTQGATVDVAALATAKPKSGLPFLALGLGDGNGVAAGAFPESTTLLLRHASTKLPHLTRVKDSTEAVNIALAFIADHSLLSLQHGEGLDVINVQALFQSESDEAGFGPVEKVAYHVVFGHTYEGMPIDGGMVLVVLDSDGNVSTFHKAWRDIIGETRVKLASESTIQSRRDPGKVAYLVEKERTCVLTEDPDPGAIHDAAGVACKFVYFDPSARD